MHSRSLMAAMLAAGAMLTAPAVWAQTGTGTGTGTGTPPSRSTDIPEERGTVPGGSTGSRAMDIRSMSAEELRDKTVYGRNKEEIATVKDVTGTPGQSRQAILHTGGMMGLGGKEVSVPLEKLSVAQDGKLVLNMTEDELKMLPKAN